MNSILNKPFNPEWMYYYIQLNQYLEQFKYTCPDFLTEYERTQVFHKINEIQNLVQIQKTRIQQMKQ